MHEDAERMARRFHLVRRMLVPALASFDELVPRERDLLIQTFDELLRADAVFPGPSLYQDGVE
jgi:hypothetical protein